MRRLSWLMIASLLAVIIASPSHAQVQPKNKGLFITPVREYIDIREGQSATEKLTVANMTGSTVTITLSVEQFSVANHTYDYEFSPVKEDWVKFELTELKLEPNKSKAVSYRITIPPGAKPGGHYFTLFATAIVSDGAVSSKVRAATVLYVTVDGELKRASDIQKETVPWISFGGDIPVMLDIKNTGNTHFFIRNIGELRGWTAKPAKDGTTHILLPGAVRTVSFTVSPPMLPGIYPITYGYKTDEDVTVGRSRYIAYVPLWALIIPVGIIWLFAIMMKRRRHAGKKSSSIDS